MAVPGNTLSFEEVTQRLPFTVRVATRADMADVAQLRAQAYGRHLPELGSRLLQPEAADFEHGCQVLLAASKLDGSLLGTLRIHSNVFQPLPLEASMNLPLSYRGSRMVEATRLSVAGGVESSLVRSALFKALYLYCVEHDVDWMLAAGRRVVDRLYDSLLFSDVDVPGAFYAMAHASGVPHRVMSLSTTGARQLWREAMHPLYQFVCHTHHPDISLQGAKLLGSRQLTARMQLANTLARADMLSPGLSALLRAV